MNNEIQLSQKNNKIDEFMDIPIIKSFSKYNKRLSVYLGKNSLDSFVKKIKSKSNESWSEYKNIIQK